MRLIPLLIACYIVLTGSLLAQAVVMEPNPALRDQPVYITIGSAAAFKMAEIRLDNRPIAPAPTVSEKTIRFTVPNDIPLGNIQVSITLDNGAHYEAPKKLALVASLSEKLGITRVEPEVVYSNQGKGRFVIFGQGFADTSSKDIRLFLNNSEHPMIWGAKDCAAETPHIGNDGIHGNVKSSRELEICNVPLNEGKMTLAIGQGADVAAAPNELSVTVWERWQVALVALGITFLAAAIVYILLAFRGSHIIKGREYRLQAAFLDKQTNTYSLSILQFHMWTLAAVFGYTYFAISKLFVQWATGLPDISGNLPGIVGIGVGTAIGSQVINSIRPKGSGEEGPSPSDFLTSGGSVAPDRVQMLVWTLIGVAGFLSGVLRENPATMKNLPGVPESLMALMGLSSVGYLGAKFARKAGPNITEISVIPASAQSAGEVSAPALAVDLSRPISVATQALQAAKAMAAGLSASSSTIATREATAAVAGLEAGLAAAAAIQKSGRSSDGLPKLIELSASTHTAAINAAAEFEKSAGTPGAETARLSASVAQNAAAAVEELASNAGQILSIAEAASNQRAQDASASFRRVIEFRGQNLSAEGIFRASAGGTEFDLPFRMLEMKDNRRMPEIIVAEEASGSPNMARTLRLTILPSQLDEVDRKTYEAVFGKEHKDLAFTIFNPDGQKSVRSVPLPPGEAQRP